MGPPENARKGGIKNLLEQLGILTELQKLDSEIIEKGRLIKAIPLRLSALDKSMKDAEEGVKRQRERYQAAEKKKKDKERELDDANDKINKLKTRTTEIKDNKAYQAHLKEIEAAEKSRWAVEDEILGLMEALDAEGKAMKPAEAALEAEKVKLLALKKELDKEITEAEKSLDVLKARRKELYTGIDEDTYKLYMSMLKSLGGLAVVEAKNEICQGCNMNVMPQLFLEIKKNERIIRCPQCGRILYYAGDAEQQ